MVLILSENWTMTDGRDLRALVRWARIAEDAGFDSVMISEHVVLGPDASDRGAMANPREYALPGNELGTLDLLGEGRLVVQPTVSWSRDEYAALGVPFDQRGRILDEQLEILEKLWRGSPVSHVGEFFHFQDVSLEPKAYRPDGPRMWFGGQHVHPRLLRRLVRYGHGYHPLGRPSDEDQAALAQGLAEAGRDVADLELIGGTQATFPDATSCADLGAAMAVLPAQIEQGFTTFCIKPSQFLDDPAQLPAFCADVIRRADQFG